MSPFLHELLFVFLLLINASTMCALSNSNYKFLIPKKIKIKNAIISVAAYITINTCPFYNNAYSFDNAIKHVDTPKSHGPKPNNLGINSNKMLRYCLKPSPNCFSTSPEQYVDGNWLDENEQTIHQIPLWTYDIKKWSPDDAFMKIVDVFRAYEPGHDNIDGGGFNIVTTDKNKRYIYVQYESLKRGYIDDVEVLVNEDGTIQVASASRLGYLDYQVNAKRLNYIAAKLKSIDGFGASEITELSHPIYFESNVIFEGPKLGLGTKSY